MSLLSWNHYIVRVNKHCHVPPNFCTEKNIFSTLIHLDLPKNVGWIAMKFFELWGNRPENCGMTNGRSIVYLAQKAFHCNAQCTWQCLCTVQRYNSKRFSLLRDYSIIILLCHWAHLPLVQLEHCDASLLRLSVQFPRRGNLISVNLCATTVIVWEKLLIHF